MEKGLKVAEASPVHIAFRGTADWGSVRCGWRGIARTAQQREDTIRLWLGIGEEELVPPPFEIENMFAATFGVLGPAFPATTLSNFQVIARGGLSTEFRFLTCYVDYFVQEYILGDGPKKLTVAYDPMGESHSYELYLKAHAAGEHPGQRLEEEEEYEKRLLDTVQARELLIAGLVGGRESVVFLAPMAAHFAIAIEAWQAVAQWDLQLSEDELPEAVRYGTSEYDPEYRQTLDGLRSRILEAAATDAFAGKRIETTAGLRKYYESIGARDVIGPYNVPRGERKPFVPASPPPPYARAPTEGNAADPTATPAVYEAPTMVAISSGGDLTCGLTADGTAVCWGGWSFGRISPTSENRFLSVSSGGDFACGIMPDATIGCWGDNYREASSPPKGKFTAIASGQDHACSIREDGAAVCWGRDNWGQSSPPEQSRFVAISVGYSHSCGLRTDGAPECWGHPRNGKLTAPTGTRLMALSSGIFHNCGLKFDGTALCWGGNVSGQAVPPEGERFTEISLGSRHSCALRADSTALCWGNDSHGQATPPAEERFVSISSGPTHTCGLRGDGTAVCWGDNEYGKAGAPGTETFTHIAVGLRFSCALRDDGTPVCWGENEHGQRTPPEGESFVSLTSDWGHACGLRQNGTAVCWGNNENGQASPPLRMQFTSISTGSIHTCGLARDGSITCWGSDEDGRATAPIGSYSMVSAGWHHTCALGMDGTATCWGNDEDGQASPPEGETFTVIESGVWHSCGIRDDGTVLCWGSDEDRRTSPPPLTFTSLSIGRDKSCGIRTSGEVACWGERYSGHPTSPPEGRFLAISTEGGHVCGIREGGVVVCWGDNREGESSPPGGQLLPDAMPEPVQTAPTPEVTNSSCFNRRADEVFRHQQRRLAHLRAAVNGWHCRMLGQRPLQRILASDRHSAQFGQQRALSYLRVRRRWRRDMLGG